MTPKASRGKRDPQRKVRIEPERGLLSFRMTEPEKSVARGVNPAEVMFDGEPFLGEPPHYPAERFEPAPRPKRKISRPSSVAGLLPGLAMLGVWALSNKRERVDAESREGSPVGGVRRGYP